MPVALLVGTAVTLLVLFYPYVLYPWLLRTLRARPLTPVAGPTPTATLVFCAYNEERSIPAKIQNLRDIRAAFPEIRFACYVDKSTDRTLELLQAHPDLIDVYAATERTGKALGMRELAMVRCQSQIMIFTDANVMVRPGDVLTLLGYFSDPAVGGVCGRLIYANSDDSITASTSSFYWRIEETIKRLESSSGSTMGADGSLFAMRRALYPEVPPHLLDDLTASMAVVFAGYRLVSAPDVLAYENAVTIQAEEFRRRRRIACRAFNTHRYLRPQLATMSPLNRFKYVSHRVVRWYGFPTMVLGAVLFDLFLALTLGPVIAVTLLIAALAFVWLAGKARVPGIERLAQVLNLLWATSLGVWDAWRGETYQTWKPAETR
jgi:cellulose synthase/poly-beta-1,6-N-acetylglucosamine synthase-like glycosyltransferase